MRVLTREVFDRCYEEAKKSKRDLYKLIAAEQFEVPYDKVTNVQRAQIKILAYAFMYGVNR